MPDYFRQNMSSAAKSRLTPTNLRRQVPKTGIL
jgi:hypothetical protein